MFEDIENLNTLYQGNDTLISTGVLKDQDRNRTIILKTSVLTSGGASKDRLIAHEYAILSRLKHPCVPKPIALRSHNARHVSLLEHCPGKTLAARFGEGISNLNELLTIAIAVSKGLHAIHQEGVIHGDLSPMNILVDDKYQVHIIDFEMASIGLTRRDPIHELATIAYLAPEATGRTGRAVDYRADLYSLGAILFEWITSHPPFRGSLAETIKGHLTTAPVIMPSLPFPIPKTLESIILKLLAKEPTHNFPNAG